jgi:hypothetical protein
MLPPTGAAISGYRITVLRADLWNAVATQRFGARVMTNKLLVTCSLAMVLLASTAANAEDGFKYRKLKPADPPCLFLLDENTGQPTGNAVNPPCVLGSQTVQPGDNVSDEARAKFGKAAEANGSGLANNRASAPRDAASGMATGKRQHKPISAAAPDDNSDPGAAGKDTTEMRNAARVQGGPPKPPGQD